VQVQFELTWRDYYKFFAMKHGNGIFMEYGTKGRDVEWRDNAQAGTPASAAFPCCFWDCATYMSTALGLVTAVAPPSCRRSVHSGLIVSCAPQAIQRWKDGTTGLPLVDANMRELKETGDRCSAAS
jgi:deoxyribodipyrimidine photolyase